MFPAWPFTAYNGIGNPVTFHVGPNHTRFSVHHFLLSKLSPIFALPNGLPRTVIAPITLPSIDPATFSTLFKWLYERVPPAYTSDKQLLDLCKLWVLAGELGIWKTANTVLRLGMALMQPRDFICRIETVRWVYEHTMEGSELRAFIITIFSQSGPPISPAVFSREIEKSGILRDAASFLRVLNRVRAGNSKGVDAYDLHSRFPMVHIYLPSKDEFGPGQIRGCLVTGGEEVEWSRIEYPLPSYLVWGANWEILPDSLFVTAERALEAAKDVTRQVEAASRGYGLHA